ncbi:hypothetical protein HY024_01745 [Candidatus Curtissbacteria bacterium]|nr:hypothetical protein [Candidatus Curtissbacteria bacterium]
MQSDQSVAPVQPQKFSQPIVGMISRMGQRRFLVFLSSAAIILIVVGFFLLQSESRVPLTSATLKTSISALSQGAFKNASGSAVLKKDLDENFYKPIAEAESFKDSNPVKERVIKFGRYTSVFYSLIGQYSATRDPQVLVLAKDTRDYIKATFPKEYASAEHDQKNFWEIKE